MFVWKILKTMFVYVSTFGNTDQVEPCFRDKINEGWKDLEGSLTSTENDRVVTDQVIPLINRIFCEIRGVTLGRRG